MPDDPQHRCGLPPTLELDALREMGNIAAAHAATALSKFSGDRVTIDIPECQFLGLEAVTSAIGLTDEPVTAVSMDVIGQYPGSVFMIFPVGTALALAESFMPGRARSTDDHAVDRLNESEPPSPISLTSIPELSREALLEIGNICICAYLNAIANFLGPALMPLPPVIALDRLPSIIEQPAAQAAINTRYLLMVKTRFLHGTDSFYGLLLFLPAQRLQSLVLERFGVEPERLIHHLESSDDATGVPVPETTGSFQGTWEEPT